MTEDLIGLRIQRKDVDDLLMKLEYVKLIKFIYHNAKRKDKRKRIQLIVPMNTVHTALKDHSLLGSSIDYIQEKKEIKNTGYFD